MDINNPKIYGHIELAKASNQKLTSALSEIEAQAGFMITEIRGLHAENKRLSEELRAYKERIERIFRAMGIAIDTLNDIDRDIPEERISTRVTSQSVRYN